MYNGVGNLVWQADLDIYGKVRTLGKGNINDCPFRYQGQYHDTEIDLYYNRFRYYSPESGTYISQDPIGLKGKNPNIYAYTSNINVLIDPFGLDPEFVNPSTLNYSQAYVSENVNDYINDMANNKWDWMQSGPLNVAEIDGQLVSLDNRRLLAAQEAGLDSVPINKINLSDPLPAPATGGTYQSNLDKKLNSKPKGSNVPRVKLPKTGTPKKPQIIPKKPNYK